MQTDGCVARYCSSKLAVKYYGMNYINDVNIWTIVKIWLFNICGKWELISNAWWCNAWSCARKVNDKLHSNYDEAYRLTANSISHRVTAMDQAMVVSSRLLVISSQAAFQAHSQTWNCLSACQVQCLIHCGWSFSVSFPGDASSRPNSWLVRGSWWNTRVALIEIDVLWRLKPVWTFIRHQIWLNSLNSLNIIKNYW